MGDIEVGIGTSSMSPLAIAQKVDFRPERRLWLRLRDVHRTPEVRIRDPMPSGTLTPFPHTMRGRPDHRSASAVPVLTVGAGGRNV